MVEKFYCKECDKNKDSILESFNPKGI